MEVGRAFTVDENVSLHELARTIHGFWDRDNNVRVPGIIDHQQVLEEKVDTLFEGQERLSLGQNRIMWGIGLTFIATLLPHVNSALFELIAKVVGLH